MIFCHHFSFMEEIYFWKSSAPFWSAFKLNYFKMKWAHYLRKIVCAFCFHFFICPCSKYCSLFCVSAISSWWFWPQLTAASCVCYLQKHLRLLTLSSSWLPTGLSKLFSFCLSSSHITSSIFLLEKSFHSFCSFITGIQQGFHSVSHLPVHITQAKLGNCLYIWWANQYQYTDAVHYLPSALKV